MRARSRLAHAVLGDLFAEFSHRPSQSPRLARTRRSTRSASRRLRRRSTPSSTTAPRPLTRRFTPSPARSAESTPGTSRHAPLNQLPAPTQLTPFPVLPPVLRYSYARPTHALVSPARLRRRLRRPRSSSMPSWRRWTLSSPDGPTSSATPSPSPVRPWIREHTGLAARAALCLVPFSPGSGTVRFTGSSCGCLLSTAASACPVICITHHKAHRERQKMYNLVPTG